MRKDVRLILFYFIYIIGAYALEKTAPSGPCTPGPGFLLLILLIPISIILFMKDLFKYIKNPESTILYCTLIHPAFWVILIIFSSLVD